MRSSSDRGIAMVATLLVMLLVSALMVGFTAVVMSDQRFRGLDRDRTAAFYAAHAGLEKLTTDLGNLFFVTVAPTAAQLAAIQAAANQPPIPGISYVQADGTSGYALTKRPATFTTIASGPYQGLIALVEPYNVDVTARTSGGGEVHLAREMHAVAIPVFQFGFFSDVDLSFFAGPVFNFGGRVHSNRNLFLAGGAPLTMSDKVTAVGEVIRQNLSNGASIDTAPAHNSTVSIASGGGAFRNLDRTEGSERGALGTPFNEPTWTNVSCCAYNHYLRNGRTGARPLNLALITIGGTNTDLVRRPATPNENVANPTLFGERDYSKASLRILLSDTAAQITNLPTVTATAPIQLDGDWAGAGKPAGYNGVNPVDGNHPPIALSMGNVATNTIGPTNAGAAVINVNSTAGFRPGGGTILLNGTRVTCGTVNAGPPASFSNCAGTPAAGDNSPVTTYYTTNLNTSPLGGFLKIESQNAAGVWTDVTLEILNYGIASASLNGNCPDPNPNAIIRLQRISDTPAHNAPCGTTGGTTVSATDYWPQALYDTREGLLRDAVPAGNSLVLAGVMYYVMLDVNNLSRWFQGIGPYAAGTGPTAWNNGGYSVYFSDRRGNQDAAGNETGEFGFEDVVNPLAADGAPNGVLDTGEDVNGDGRLQVYGGVPHPLAGNSAIPLDATANLGTVVTANQAQANRAIFFRRALKLVNGTLGQIVAPGFTVVSENPVYIQGNWNANAGGFGDPHVATAVIADAVTLLTNNWNDDVSFAQPYAPGNRPGADTWFRVAVIAGKGVSFPQPAGTATDFGTDGGAHNFLRMLEGGNRTVNYRGSLATFYYNRQAIGTFKCCATVYSPPTRNFAFDTDFLDPTKLPPLTPMFRDVNTVTFSQEIRPGR
jgi:hypothetical protein